MRRAVRRPVRRRSRLAATVATCVRVALACTLLALFALPALADDAPAPDRAPNVLLLLADDLQWDALSALGGRIDTPNLDALSARGATFTHVYNQGSPHGAVCAPSRAMLLTGRHLWRRGGDACEDRLLWPEWFRAHGYATFATGKWHNGRAALERGFEELGPTAGGMLPSTEVGGEAYDRGADGGAWRPDDETRAGHWMDVDGRTVHSSERWVDEALGFLDRRAARDDARPFLAWVAFHAPHDPRQAPARWQERNRPEDQVLPPNVLPGHPFDQGALRIRDELLAPFPRTEGAVRRHMAEYAAIVAHLDEQVGRLLDDLRARGLEDGTLVLFTSDHGLAVGQHGLLGKQSLYEHSTRVSLLVAGPGVPAGRRVDVLVPLHALFATSCELAGLPTPDTLDVGSLAPFLGEAAPEAFAWRATAATPDADAAGDADDDAASRDRPVPPPGTIHAAYAMTQRMVRDDRHKLVVYPELGRVQLFDLVDDPWETTDRSADDDAAPVIRRLLGDLATWMRVTEDPLPVDAVRAARRDG